MDSTAVSNASPETQGRTQLELASELQALAEELLGCVRTEEDAAVASEILERVRQLKRSAAWTGPSAGPALLRAAGGPHSVGRAATAASIDLSAIVQSLAAVRREVERTSARLKELTSSRSWKITRPLRYLTGLRHRRGAQAQPWQRPRSSVAGADAAGVESVRDIPPARWLLDVELQLLALGLATARRDKADIYLWGVIDWHFRTQRPQHLARALAERGHRVFYISSELHDRPNPGFELEPLDADGRLYQAHFNLAGRPVIYGGAPSPHQFSQLAAGLAALERWNGASPGVSIIEHPFWAELARRSAGSRIVYDCLDHQAGFSDNAEVVLREEHALVAGADLVIVTSQWLQDNLVALNPRNSLIRNGGDYQFFAQAPDRVFRDPQGRKVLGYYGAIESWLDLDLVRAIGQRFPAHLVLLIGRAFKGASQSVADVPNIMFHDEVPYEELPYWLHGFDVCLLPFKVLPLTLATNPVKVYEYLSAGKPVVAVDLPEMSQFGGLVRTAATHDGFLDAVAELLDSPENVDACRLRRDFASQQTWKHRVDEMEAALATIQTPRASVIVVTYGNLDYTRNCLESLERFSHWPDLEVIVVDNASQDGTPQFLRQWRDEGNGRHVILNDRNLGFAAANNQGLAVATGEYLLLLNNDTYVTSGWVRGLVAHLDSDPSVGLVGPVTNNIGNEARIEIDYADMDQMAERSSLYIAMHRGESAPMRTLAFFCVAMTRRTYEKIGALCEDFGTGFFEDDDYCRRAEQAGLRCVRAEDVFIHHHLSASFDRLDPADRQALFERNKAIYEHKWGAWTSHSYR